MTRAVMGLNREDPPSYNTLIGAFQPKDIARFACYAGIVHARIATITSISVVRLPHVTRWQTAFSHISVLENLPDNRERS